VKKKYHIGDERRVSGDWGRSRRGGGKRKAAN